MDIKRLLTLSVLALALVQPSAAADEARVPAFPGAEGYGKWATGGRGGKTYVVESLDDCDESNLKKGTLRWAVKQPGKKIVTFKVNGTIYLKSPLCFDAGDLTILGQTAPGDGICIADYPVTISCENAIIRYIRFRLGNRQVAFHEGDGFGFQGADNVIMDHCSVSWSIDECLSISAATNLTIQWCMIEQALNNAGHQKGAHGYGGNWGGTNVSFHHNLITQCTSRVPRLGGDTDPETNDYCDLRNNVFYNWGGEGCYGAEAIDVNFVNNYYKPGPCTDQRNVARRKRICAIGIRTKSYVTTYPAFAHDLHKWGHFYVDGNVNPDYEDVTDDNWTYGILNQVDGSKQDGTWTATTKDTIHLKEPREFVSVTTHSAEQAYEKVLAYAGASLYRDAVDALMVAQVENRMGEQKSGSNGALWGQIDCQIDNKLDASLVENDAWPILSDRQTGYEDSDGDGIDDEWEASWGLNSEDGTDGATLYDGDDADFQGYAYVEIYQNQKNKKRRTWNANGLEDGTVEGTDEPTSLCLRRMPWEHEVSALTFKGYDSRNKRQMFADNVSMDATGGIYGGTGENHTLKLKAQKYTIRIPNTFKATAIRVSGYPNYDGDDIYVSQVNKQRFETTDYVLKGKREVWSDFTIPLEKPLSGTTLAITFVGNAPTVRMYLIDDTKPEDTPSEVTGISDTTLNDSQNVNNEIYDLSGHHIANGQWSMFNGQCSMVKGQLKRGMYIVRSAKGQSSRKVVVK